MGSPVGPADVSDDLADGTEDAVAGQGDGEPDPYAIARQIVLRQLALAPRSRAQLEAKLRARGCADDVAARVLDRFTDVGLIDDASYAAMLVNTRRTTKGLARRALRSELRTKGVAAETIEETLGSVTDEDERADARALVDKRLRTMSGLPADIQARRLAAMLARKGHGGAVALSVIREALREAPEHQRD